jgi:starch-binding outer membrane protein, SusD/RagB family
VDDSRISNLTAYHVLSEVYISLNQWQNAIDAATIVINHPSVGLMTQRFGTRKNDPMFGGDVYWDLFRKGNQNRSSGDKESLWVLQFEYNMEFTGGGKGGTNIERMLMPSLWRFNIYNKNGKTALLIPLPNTYYYGRGLGAWWPTKYFFKELGEKSGYSQDMRNSEYNIVRDFKVNNPASDWNGKWVFKDNLPVKLLVSADSSSIYPVIAKGSDPGKHPIELYSTDQTVPGSLTSQARYTFRDHCVIRLAETYLLRAEAFLGNNNKTKAADDINVVRRRANAPDVNPAIVDIDYILDERLRELHFEELRTATLTRLGKLVERTRKYNGSVPYLEHHNLWPIPFSEIEKNVGAVLEQNSGY